MSPQQLTSEQFKAYPPLARELAGSNLALFRRLPLVFLANLLRELIEYDYQFPLEQTALTRQIAYLAALSPSQLASLFSSFNQLHVSTSQATSNWVDQPLAFTEQLSAYLWSTNQMDAFREAATAYGIHLQAAVARDPLPAKRLGIAIIGAGANPKQTNLFTKLRPHGTYFSNIDPSRGLEDLLAEVEARAETFLMPYGHWYVDGGTPKPHSQRLACVSYSELSFVRAALLSKIQERVSKPGMGPEELRDQLAVLSPSQLGMKGDPVLDHFQLKMLTEGSGTQVFSTTFAQWTSREVLRRAEALTLLVRFAPRQRQRSLNDLLTNSVEPIQLDLPGSLIDADMAAYYHWINQQRLPGANQASFVVWLEGGTQAVAIGPSIPRGALSRESLTLQNILFHWL